MAKEQFYSYRCAVCLVLAAESLLYDAHGMLYKEHKMRNAVGRAHGLVNRIRVDLEDLRDAMEKTRG